jgi:hypothetical protein
MKSKIKLNARFSLTFAVVMLALGLAPWIGAQAPSRFLGTITGISGTTLTVKTDAGDTRTVDVPGAASLKRIAPGQKDLSTAETIQFSDLANGDRVLVRLDPNGTGANGQAQQIIAIKQADVAQKQQKDREDWQRRGIGGLVKSVDSANGVILVTSGIGATAKTITVHTTKATTLRRYAPASVSFDAAVAAPIDAIHAGDQLRARGAKSADGMSIDADEVISGTFRNISGTVGAIDPATSSFTIKDLATKKQLTVKITPDAQMKRLPEMMARMLAARLKGGAGGSGAGGGAGASSAYSAQGQRGGAGQYSGSGAPGGAGRAGGNSGGQASGLGSGSGTSGGSGFGGGGGQGGDPNQMLSRLPAIQLSDLKKGEAVMLVSTDGTTEVTAITLLAGVEPLLEAPAASQSLLNNWSMGSGGAEAAAAQ